MDNTWAQQNKDGVYLQNILMWYLKKQFVYRTDIYENPKWHYIYKSIRGISNSIGDICKSIRDIFTQVKI